MSGPPWRRLLWTTKASALKRVRWLPKNAVAESSSKSGLALGLGFSREYDMSNRLRGPVFEALHGPAVIAQVNWPNTAPQSGQMLFR